MHFDINWCYSISRHLRTTMQANNKREMDINNLLHNGNSPIATRLNDNTTDEASLPPNVVTTPPCDINNRSTNYTSVDELKVQALKGGLIRDYQKCAYTHILRELLGDAANKETLIALDEYGITSLPKLLELIRTPGSIIGLRYNGEMLREDQYERLLTLYSYLNWLQMVYGPIADGVFNIFRASRNHFEGWFISDVYDVSNPIIYSEDGELLNQQYSIDTRRLLRLRFGYEENIPNVYYNTVNPNSDYPTPTAYDNEMWHCNYFQNTIGVMDGKSNGSPCGFTFKNSTVKLNRIFFFSLSNN